MKGRLKTENQGNNPISDIIITRKYSNISINTLHGDFIKEDHFSGVMDGICVEVVFLTTGFGFDCDMYLSVKAIKYQTIGQNTGI